MGKQVENWLNELTESTSKLYKAHFNLFLKWADNKVDLQKINNQVVRDYLLYRKTNAWSTQTRKAGLAVLRSYCDFIKKPLKKISRAELNNLLEPSKIDVQKAMIQRPLKVRDIKEVLVWGYQPYKTIIQLMFQSGMGLAEFEYFNMYGWDQIKDQLNNAGAMKINLIRKKTSQQKVQTYYTFIGEEGKQAIKDWLKIRAKDFGEIKDGDPIFIVRHKITHKVVPPKGYSIEMFLIRMQKKLNIKPLIDDKFHTRYLLHAHEMRDVFKSLCTLAGVNAVASEFFLGHTIDKLGYDKSPLYDSNFFMNEYLKVEPKLGIWNIVTDEANQLKTMIKNKFVDLDKMDLEQLRNIGSTLGIHTTEPSVEGRGLVQISDGMMAFPENTPYEIKRQLVAMIYHKLGLRPEKDEAGNPIPKPKKIETNGGSPNTQKIIDENDLVERSKV
ncbi:MAG: site-specific integrase [Candidatus Bathyarchaeota archaeon]